MSAADNRVLTPEQVAEQLHVTVPTVYGLIRRGELKAIKIGRLWRIPAWSLDRLIGAPPETPTPK